MHKLTIAHISDLHLMMDASPVDQQIVLSALFRDIESERNKIGKIDAVFFTGDLVGKGKYAANSHHFISDNFIDPLLRSTGISANRFFMVPGNHDFEQTRLPDTLRLVFENLNTVDLVNKSIDQMDKTPSLWAGFENYNNLRDEFVKAEKIISNHLFAAYRFQFAEKNIGICAINSAWCSSGKPDDYDYGKLLIGQRQLDILTQSVSNCNIKIALLHHPISWLAQFDQIAVQQYLYSSFDAIFFGHNHRADFAALASSAGHTFLSNAGCLYQGRNYFNGYTLASYDFEMSNWNVNVREYYEEKKIFSASERFASGGLAIFNLNGSSIQHADILLPTSEFFETISETINSQLLSSTISDVAPRDLKQIFVVPPLCSVSEKRSEAIV